MTGIACDDDGDPCTNDLCASGVCTHADKCPGQYCCPNGECCDTACEECLDNGSLSGGTIAVDPVPACVGDTIAFTVSGVTDDGAIKRVDCSAKTLIPAVPPTYTWTITKPDTSEATGSGPVPTALASEFGAYAVTFTAKAERDCPPPDIDIAATVDVQTTATLTLEPSFIPASTAWLGMPDASHSVITVVWDPPECEGTLQIAEVVGDFGYVPPGSGTLTQPDPPKWRYDAFTEPAGELCAKPVTVSIAALKNDVELERRNIRVLPVHEWTVTNHADGPGTPIQPPDVTDFTNAYNYLLWKYATVLATTGGAFAPGGVSISPDDSVHCPAWAFWTEPVYACTTGADVVFGTNTFRGSENQAASIIGHELVHTALGSLAGECPAYQWEADHSVGTGTTPCDTAYITSVLQYLADPENCP